MATSDQLPYHIEQPIQNFVRTLYQLTNGPYESTLIDWTPDGSSIVIAEPARFAAEICPCFFRHENWSSFSRMLNMYQFHKVPMATATRTACFAHPLFYRGGHDALWRVVQD